MTDKYDPFARGPFTVDVRGIEARDPVRDRLFPCEIWYPADAGACPLIVFSHSSGSHRQSATFLCTHLSSHGYVVAAINHSEVIAPELVRKLDESEEHKAARWQAVIDSRVPDVRFLLDHLLKSGDPQIDPRRIGIVGHSFGGWTALATPEADSRIRAVVALAPGGNSRPRPGILPAKLTFGWGRDVPTLYLAAQNDVAIPLAGIYELFERTPATKRMVILRRADHAHFMDNIAEQHERLRTMQLPAELDWLQKEMLPMAELCSEEQAHLFTRGLTVAHMDATLKQQEQARRFLAGDLVAELAERGVDAIVYKP
jgi:dienelactone hydrolase